MYWIIDYTGSKGKPFVYKDAWKQDRAAGRFSRIESSWAEHTAYIETMHSLIQPALDEELATLAHSVRAEGDRVVVYNPLPWERDGAVTVTWNRKPPSGLMSLDTSEVLPVDTRDSRLHFVARKVPPMGYRVYLPSPAKPESKGKIGVDASGRSMENSFFRVVLDPARGAIQSIVDQRTGQELVDTAAPHGFGQYLYERFDLDQVQAFVTRFASKYVPWTLNEFGKPNLPPASEAPYRAITPSTTTLRFQEGDAAVTAILESAAGGELCHAVTTRVILYRDLPVLDLEVTLHDKPADPWPEAGWICLPLKIDEPQFRLGRLGSIIDPTRDLVPSSNHHVMALNTGMTVTGPHNGVGLCPMDHPLVSLDVPGCWKWTRDFVPRQPRVYVNLFNNQWTTNFRFWNQGTWTSRCPPLVRESGRHRRRAGDTLPGGTPPNAGSGGYGTGRVSPVVERIDVLADRPAVDRARSQPRRRRDRVAVMGDCGQVGDVSDLAPSGHESLNRTAGQPAWRASGQAGDDPGRAAGGGVESLCPIELAATLRQAAATNCRNSADTPERAQGLSPCIFVHWSGGGQCVAASRVMH